MKQNLVIKFGGSSLSTPEMMSQALSITAKAYQENQVSVVVSALGGVTNKLIELAQKAIKTDSDLKDVFEALKGRHREQFRRVSESDFTQEMGELFRQLWECLATCSISKQLTSKQLDEIMSFGERFSVRMFVAGLNQIGIPSVYRDTHLLVKTDSLFGDANVQLEESAKNLRKAVDLVEGVVVFTGFIGSNEKNEITTLGRSGSDFTAGLVGYSIDADLVEIWTDVDGVFTTDPNIIKDAILIPELSYSFMEIMADNGAKVLHPRTVRPLQLKEIPILIKNTFNPEATGTLVDVKSVESAKPITTVGIRKGQVFVSAEDLKSIRKKLSEELFDYLETKATQIQTHKEVAGVSLASSNPHVSELTEVLETVSGGIKAVSQITLLTTGTFLNTQLYKTIDLLSMSTIRVFGYLFENKSIISIFVNEEASEEALKLIHDFFCKD